MVYACLVISRSVFYTQRMLRKHELEIERGCLCLGNSCPLSLSALHKWLITWILQQIQVRKLEWVHPRVAFYKNERITLEQKQLKLTKIQTPKVLRGSFHVYETSVQQHGRAEHHGTVSFPVGWHFGLHTRTHTSVFTDKPRTRVSQASSNYLSLFYFYIILFRLHRASRSDACLDLSVSVCTDCIKALINEMIVCFLISAQYCNRTVYTAIPNDANKADVLLLVPGKLMLTHKTGSYSCIW